MVIVFFKGADFLYIIGWSFGLQLAGRLGGVGAFPVVTPIIKSY